MSTINSVGSPVSTPLQTTSSPSSASGGDTSAGSTASAEPAGAGAAAGGGGSSDSSGATTTTITVNADGTETITTKNAQGQVISVVTEGEPNKTAQNAPDGSTPAGSRLNITT